MYYPPPSRLSGTRYWQESALCIRELEILEALGANRVSGVPGLELTEDFAPRGMVDLGEQQVRASVGGAAQRAAAEGGGTGTGPPWEKAAEPSWSESVG